MSRMVGFWSEMEFFTGASQHSEKQASVLESELPDVKSPLHLLLAL